MTELEKCMAGEYYNCHDRVFLEYKNTARRLLQKYHELTYEQKKEKNGDFATVIWRHRYERICRSIVYM